MSLQVRIAFLWRSLRWLRLSFLRFRLGCQHQGGARLSQPQRFGRILASGSIVLLAIASKSGLDIRVCPRFLKFPCDLARFIFFALLGQSVTQPKQ